MKFFKIDTATIPAKHYFSIEKSDFSLTAEGEDQYQTKLHIIFNISGKEYRHPLSPSYRLEEMHDEFWEEHKQLYIDRMQNFITRDDLDWKKDYIYDVVNNTFV